MNAREYNDKVMNGDFKKIYPEIAWQIVNYTNVKDGICVDLGGGPGMLGVWLAKFTNLHVIVYDLMKECVDLVLENSKRHKVAEQVSARQGMAENINLPDASVDLVASRGSVFFWEDQEKGISEVYRILKPGGWAYIGGGFGTKKLLDEIMELKANDIKWLENKKKRTGKKSVKKFEELLEKLDVKGTVENTEVGTWMIFQKSKN